MLSHKGPLPTPQSLINSFTISSSLVRQTRLRVGNAQRRTLHFYEMRINEILKFWWREFSLVIERRLRKCRAWAQRRWSKYGTKSWNVCDEEEATFFEGGDSAPSWKFRSLFYDMSRNAGRRMAQKASSHRVLSLRRNFLILKLVIQTLRRHERDGN